MGLKNLTNREKSGGLQSLVNKEKERKTEEETEGLQNFETQQEKETFKLPGFFGGGEFFERTSLEDEPVTTERSVSQSTKEQLRGGSFQETDKEVDHIVPKSLGGTDSPANLQALESELSFTQKIGSLFGKEYSPGERLEEKRQEGKMKKEWEAIDKYKSGEISLPQARQRVLNWKEPKSTSDYFLESLVESPKDIFNNVKDWLSTEDAKDDKQEYDYEEELSEQRSSIRPQEQEQQEKEETLDFSLVNQEAEDEAKDALSSEDLSAWQMGKKQAEDVQDVMKEVGQAVARSIVAGSSQAPKTLGYDKVRKLLGVKDRIERKGFLQNEYIPKSKLEQSILGTEDPISLESVGREYPGGDKMSPGLAIAVGTIDAGLNLIPGGKSTKGVARKITKTSDIPTIKKELKSIFSGSDEVLDKLSKTLSKENKFSKVEGSLKNIKAKKLKERKNFIKKRKQERKEFDNKIKKESKNIAETFNKDKIKDKIKGIYKNLDNNSLEISSEILSKTQSSRKAKQELQALEVKDSLIRTGAFPTNTGQADIVPVAGQKKVSIPDIDNKLKRLQGERIKLVMGKGKGSKKTIKDIDKATAKLRKQRNDILSKENVAFSTNEKGKVIPSIRNKSGIVAEKEWETHNFKDAGAPTDNLLSWATNIDNITYGEGVGTAWKFADNAYTKIADRNDFINTMSRSANKILKDNGMLKGIFKTPRKKDMRIIYDILNSEEGIKGITAKHKKAAKDIRKLLDETHKQANETRQMLNKEPMGYIENYISHMERSNVWRDLLGKGQARASENLDFVIPNEQYNQFIKKRVGGIKDKEKNIAKILDKYFSNMADEVHTNPLIEKSKAISKTLENRGLTKSSDFLNKWIQSGLIGKPTSLDTGTGLKAGSKLRKTVAGYNHARVLGSLVGNLKWWLFTQPMSMANTVKETGLLNTAGGIMDWMTNPALRREIKNVPGMRLKNTAGAGETVMGQLDNTVGKLYKSKIDKYNDIVGANIDFMENHLTGASMAAGLRKAKQSGLKGKDATRLADYTGQVTQSMYNKEARPQMLQSLATKTAFPFQTFNTEMWRHLKNMAGKGGGIPRTAQQRAKNVINLTTGTMMVNYINKKATGQNLTTPGSFIPLVGSYVDDMGGKIADSALGRLGIQEKESSQGMRRNIVAPFEDGKQLTRAITDAVDHNDFSKMRELLVFWGAGGFGAAGGGQINKMIDGLIATQQEEVKGVTGETMFEVDGVDEKTRAILLGPYGTEAAKDYFAPSKEEEDDEINFDKEINLEEEEADFEKEEIDFNKEINLEE